MPHVSANIEEIAVFDDASQDETYALAMGLPRVRQHHTFASNWREFEPITTICVVSIPP